MRKRLAIFAIPMNGNELIVPSDTSSPKVSEEAKRKIERAERAKAEIAAKARTHLMDHRGRS